MKLADWLIARITRREPDFIIGGAERPYIRRWWVFPRNRFFNVYLHQFLRSDDDRALHDHPWSNLSILLRGSYIEHTIAAGGIASKQLLTAPAFRVRPSGSIAHRLELLEDVVVNVARRTASASGEPIECWTLFITGPRYREWGFHCPDAGWIHWKDFTAADDIGAVGRGCEQ